MTKQEFKRAMLRGHGRCIQAVRKAPEKYRNIVLWACKRNIAYDAQSEGTRSWYVYTMTNAYPDTESFISAAADALRRYRPNSGWNLLHLSELLMFCAMDGYKTAQQAVEEKYRELLRMMHQRKRRPNGVFHELSDLEQLGLVLAVDRRSFLRIAGDFGGLYQEKRYMDDGDFAWFFEAKGMRYRKTMERAAQTDENIACFLRRELASIAGQEEMRKQRMTSTPEKLTGIRLSRWLSKNADRETLEHYALAYPDQTEPRLRAEALEAFSMCPYPGDPLALIEDTDSSCEQLQTTAWHALEHIRHPAVRSFALRNTQKGNHTSENFALLVTNYTLEDGELLETLLRELICKKDRDGIHSAGMEIYRTFYKDSGIPHPKHLLPLLYEYNPCSYCRQTALEYMSRHRMLTTEILKECLYDSNDEIRRMAKRKLDQ